MKLEEAKEFLNNKGYILEDTETNNDETAAAENDWWNATMDVYKDKTVGGNSKLKNRKNKMLKKYQELRYKNLDLEDKKREAYNFNMKNFFNGVLNGLKNSYKKVTQEPGDYDDDEKYQFVRYWFTNNKTVYCLEVMYYDEDGVVKLQIFEEDSIGAYEKDDFSITTIDEAIEQVLDFVKYQVG